jgi:hypothetical protein
MDLCGLVSFADHMLCLFAVLADVFDIKLALVILRF